jgi:hypothetical protein
MNEAVKHMISDVIYDTLHTDIGPYDDALCKEPQKFLLPFQGADCLLTQLS